MKKFGIFAMMAFIVGLCFSSCGERRENLDDAIASKIEQKEALTGEDYARMIQYVGEYAEKAQNYVVNGTNTPEEQEAFSKLNAEYPLLDTFRQCIAGTPIADFTPDNLQLMQQYAGYLEFSAPAGFTIQTDPGAAGLEVQSPEGNSADTGVVAGAVDQEKVTGGGW